MVVFLISPLPNPMADSKQQFLPNTSCEKAPGNGRDRDKDADRQKYQKGSRILVSC